MPLPTGFKSKLVTLFANLFASETSRLENKGVAEPVKMRMNDLQPNLVRVKDK